MSEIVKAKDTSEICFCTKFGEGVPKLRNALPPKKDEFSGKIQTASEPPALVTENYIALFAKKIFGLV